MAEDLSRLVWCSSCVGFPNEHLHKVIWVHFRVLWGERRKRHMHHDSDGEADGNISQHVQRVHAGSGITSSLSTIPEGSALHTKCEIN
eukprot:5843708-Pyramimonas_sp.AAC.1